MTELTGNACLCRGCNEVFQSVTGFDKHRVGKHEITTGPDRRRCMTTEEMVQCGMIKNVNGKWITAKMPISGLPAWKTGGRTENRRNEPK